jgi:hypothetical protein
METSFRIKSSIIWHITLCGPLNFNRSFEETYGLYLQGRSIRQARNQKTLLMGPEAGLDPPAKRNIRASALTGLFFLRVNMK